jgi:hypothetical protein
VRNLLSFVLKKPQLAALNCQLCPVWLSAFLSADYSKQTHPTSSRPTPNSLNGENMASRNLTLVTGASSGIGLELARVFAQNRYDLIVNLTASVWKMPQPSCKKPPSREAFVGGGLLRRAVPRNPGLRDGEECPFRMSRLGEVCRSVPVSSERLRSVRSRPARSRTGADARPHERCYLFWLTLVVVPFELDASCSRSFFIRLTSTRPPLMRFGFSSEPVACIGALPMPTT